MGKSLSIGILLDIATNTTSVESLFGRIEKKLTTMSQMTSALTNEFTKYTKNGIRDTSAFSEAIKNLTLKNSDLANSIISASEQTTNALSNYRKGTQDFFQLNSLNEYIKGTRNLEKSMNELFIDFSKSEENIENFSNNINSIISTNPKNLIKFAKATEDFVKNIDEFNPMISVKIIDLMDELKESKTPEQVAKLTKQIQVLVDTQKGIIKLTDSIKNFSRSIVSYAASAIGITSIVGDTLRAQDIIYKSTAKMGLVARQNFGQMRVGSEEWLTGFRQTARQYQDEVMRVAQTTSIKFHDAAEAFNAIVEERLPTDNLKTLGDITTTTIQMAQAFNISQTEAAGFAADLIKIGQVGPQGFTDAANALATVQANLGLTGGEARDVTAQVGKMIRTMGAYGKTVKDIGKMTSEVARLQIAFKKVGLEASDANSIIDQMMNPDNIDNLIAQAAMAGVSAIDAIKAQNEGNVEIMERIMKGASDRIVGMGKSAGNMGSIVSSQLAQSFGMDSRIMSAVASSAYEFGEAETTAATIAEAAEAQRLSTLEQMNKMWNQTSLTLSKQIIPVLDKIAQILKVIVDGFMNVVQKVQNSGKLLQAVFALLIVDVLSFGKISGLVFKGLGEAMNASGLSKAFKKLISGMLSQAKTAGPQIAQAIQGPLTKSGRPDMRFKANRVGPTPPSPVTAARIPREGPSPAAMTAQTSAMQQQGNVAGKASGGLQKFADALLKIGAGILMVGAGIGILIVSIAVLANAMKGMTAESMVGLSVVLAIVMAGMIGLALVAKNSAADMVAFGSGIALIGIGIGLISLSLAALIKVISEIDNAWGSMAVAIVAIVAILAALGAVAYFASAPIAALGVGMLTLGASVALIMLSISALLLTINSLGSNMIKVGAVFAALLVTIGLFAAGLVSLAPVLLAGATALSPLAIALLSVGAAFLLVGAGVALVGAGFKAISSSIVSMTENTKGSLGRFLELSAAITVLSLTSALMAIPLAAGAIALLAFGAALIVAGAGALIAAAAMAAIGTSLEIMTKGFESLSKIDWGTIAKIGVIMAGLLVASLVGAKAAIGLGLLGLALLSIGAATLIISTGLSSLTKSLSELSNISGTVKDDFENIGVAIKGMNDVIDLSAMNKMLYTFSGMGDAAKSIAQVSDAIGKLINSITNFVSSTASIGDLASRLAPLGDALKSVFSSAQDTIGTLGELSGGQIKQVGPAFEGIGAGIGAALGPISEFMTKMDQFSGKSDAQMKALTDNMKASLEATFASFDVLINSFGKLNPKELEHFGPAFQGFGTGLKDLVEAITIFYDKFSSSASQEALTTATNNLKLQLTILGGVFNTFSSTIGSKSKESGEAFKLFGEGLKSFSDALSNLASNYQKINEMLTNGDFVSKIGSMASIIKDFNKAIQGDVDITKVGDSMKMLGEGLSSIAKGITDISGTISNLTTVNSNIKALQDVLTNIGKLTITTPPGISQFASDLNSLSNIDSIERLTAGIQKLSEMMSNTNFTSGAEKFSSLLYSMSTYGSTAVSAINAINAAINQIDFSKFSIFDRMFGGTQKQITANLNSTIQSTSAQGPDKAIYDNINKNVNQIADNTRRIAENTSIANGHLSAIKEGITRLALTTRSGSGVTLDTARNNRG